MVEQRSKRTHRGGCETQRLPLELGLSESSQLPMSISSNGVSLKKMPASFVALTAPAVLQHHQLPPADWPVWCTGGQGAVCKQAITHGYPSRPSSAHRSGLYTGNSVRYTWSDVVDGWLPSPLTICRSRRALGACTATEAPQKKPWTIAAIVTGIHARFVCNQTIW
jgi:hypothetical protein